MKEFLYDRHNSYLVRWHHSPTWPKENLAEHHFYTARIAFWLTEALADMGSFMDPADVALLALFHDEPETQIGDIPGFVKQQIPGAREAVKSWEAWGLARLAERAPEGFSERLVALCEYAEDRETVAGQIIRYADTLAALSYVEDQYAMGNRHPHLKVLHEALTAQAEECQWPWLDKLRGRFNDLP